MCQWHYIEASHMLACFALWSSVMEGNHSKSLWKHKHNSLIFPALFPLSFSFCLFWHLLPAGSVCWLWLRHAKHSLENACSCIACGGWPQGQAWCSFPICVFCRYRLLTFRASLPTPQQCLSLPISWWLLCGIWKAVINCTLPVITLIYYLVKRRWIFDRAQSLAGERRPEHWRKELWIRYFCHSRSLPELGSKPCLLFFARNCLGHW